MSYLCEAQVEKTDQQMVGGNPLSKAEIPKGDTQNPVIPLSQGNTPLGTRLEDTAEAPKAKRPPKAGVLTQSDETALKGGLYQKEWVRPKP